MGTGSDECMDRCHPTIAINPGEIGAQDFEIRKMTLDRDNWIGAGLHDRGGRVADIGTDVDNDPDRGKLRAENREEAIVE